MTNIKDILSSIITDRNKHISDPKMIILIVAFALAVIIILVALLLTQVPPTPSNITIPSVEKLENVLRGTLINFDGESITIQTDSDKKKELKIGPGFKIFHVKDGKPEDGEVSQLITGAKINVHIDTKDLEIISVLIE